MREENINLAEATFWDDYWENCILPNEVNASFSFERCLSQALKEHLNIDFLEREAFEIGCAPGKWLAFMAKEFGLKPNGVEYSKSGMEATMKNFHLMGLNSGKIQTGDFFQIKPDRQFELVMSFGFIEHFTDVDSVVELHLKWLKPGGTLILGVPNFNGIYKIIQKILNNEILEKHNLDIMNLSYFHHLASKFNLQKNFIGYIGSFEPVLPIGGKDPVSFLQFCTNIFLQITKKMRRLRLFDNINHPFFSSYILSIYKKSNS